MHLKPWAPRNSQARRGWMDRKAGAGSVGAALAAKGARYRGGISRASPLPQNRSHKTLPSTGIAPPIQTAPWERACPQLQPLHWSQPFSRPRPLPHEYVSDFPHTNIPAAWAHSDIGSRSPFGGTCRRARRSRPRLLPPSTALLTNQHGQFHHALKLCEAGKGLNFLGQLD